MGTPLRTPADTGHGIAELLRPNGVSYLVRVFRSGLDSHHDGRRHPIVELGYDVDAQDGRADHGRDGVACRGYNREIAPTWCRYVARYDVKFPAECLQMPCIVLALP